MKGGLIFNKLFALLLAVCGVVVGVIGRNWTHMVVIGIACLYLIFSKENWVVVKEDDLHG